MITKFKNKNNKSIKKSKNYKTLTRILKSFDTFVTIATISSFITFGLTGIGSIIIPISSSIACGLSVSIKVIYEIVMQRDNKYKKQ